MAEVDLAEIVDYTTDVWGPKQADFYLDGLIACFARIALNPGLGRRCDSIHRGFRRTEEGKHVIFYQSLKRDVFISRILHQTMLPARHELLEDDS